MAEAYRRVGDLADAVEALVQNSLEAGCRLLTVRVHVAKQRLQVIDDGLGMTAEQLRSLSTALEQRDQRTGGLYHVIRLAECAVVESRRKGSALACRLRFDKHMDVAESMVARSCPGTTVTVRGLFCRPPDHQKVVDKVEQLNSIVHCLKIFYVVNGTVTIRLVDAELNRLALGTRPCDGVDQAFGQVFGGEYAHPLRAYGGRMWLGARNHAHGRLQLVYARGRPVSDDAVKATIREHVKTWRQSNAYSNRAGDRQGRWPVFVFLADDGPPEGLKVALHEALPLDVAGSVPETVECPLPLARRQSSFCNVTMTKAMLQEIQVIGQFDKRFIICKAVLPYADDDSNTISRLLLFDQHAVSERIRLELLLKEHVKDGRLSRVRLEEPMRLSTAGFTASFRQLLEPYGVEWKEAADGVMVVTTLPACFVGRSAGRSESEAHKFLKTLLKELSSTALMPSSATLAPVIRWAFNDWACKGAVKFGDLLTVKQCQCLMSQLAECQWPFRCAHGRRSFYPLCDLSDE